jgi:sirohydrochlorin ferrochelatase
MAYTSLHDANKRIAELEASLARAQELADARGRLLAEAEAKVARLRSAISNHSAEMREALSKFAESGEARLAEARAAVAAIGG